MRSFWLLSVLLAALLATGCLGGKAPAGALDDGQPIEPAIIPEPDVAGPTPAPAVVPVWKPGDAWAVKHYDGDGERAGHIVVTAATGDSYTLETTDEASSSYDAMFDMSYLGKIRASDLAGHQQGQPVQFFSFPLEDGKTWTTTWDGEEVALTATQTPRGFDIVGTIDGEEYVVYDYLPELRWWSHLDFVQDGYGLRVERAMEGWAGTLASATAKLVYEAGTTAPVLTQGSGAFTIDEGQTAAFVTVIGGGERWARTFWLFDPTGQRYENTQITNVDSEAAGPRREFLTESIPATPGEWHVVFDAAHDPSGGFTLTVHQLAIAEKAFA